jgi:hypothetical protein
MEHDLFGKPASTPGVKPEGVLFRIMLYPLPWSNALRIAT